MARAIRWRAIAGGAAGALALLALLRTAGGDAPGVVSGLRLGAAALAAGTGYLFDDRAAAITAAAPLPLWVRRMLRLGTGVAAAAAAWAGLLAIGEAMWPAPGPALPKGDLTLEFAAMAAVALGAASLRISASGSGGGVAAGAALVAGIAACTAHPRLALWMLAGVPGGEVWNLAHLRWGVVAAAAAGLTLLLMRDPGAGRRSRV